MAVSVSQRDLILQQSSEYPFITLEAKMQAIVSAGKLRHEAITLSVSDLQESLPSSLLHSLVPWRRALQIGSLGSVTFHTSTAIVR